MRSESGAGWRHLALEFMNFCVVEPLTGKRDLQYCVMNSSRIGPVPNVQFQQTDITFFYDCIIQPRTVRTLHLLQFSFAYFSVARLKTCSYKMLLRKREACSCEKLERKRSQTREQCAAFRKPTIGREKEAAAVSRRCCNRQASSCQRLKLQ